MGTSQPELHPVPRAEPAAPLQVHRVVEQLRAALERLFPRESAADREDIAQAALLKLLELAERGEKHVPRSASYLWQVAYTTAVDELRRRRRRCGMESRREQEIQSAAPHVSAPRHELRSALRDCLSHLADARRAAVALHLQGFSAEETARALGANLKRSQNLLYRGLGDLRSCLSAKGFGQ